MIGTVDVVEGARAVLLALGCLAVVAVATVGMTAGLILAAGTYFDLVVWP